MHKTYLFPTILLLACYCPLSAQSLPGRAGCTLSPSEGRHQALRADIAAESDKTLYANPAFTEWAARHDTLLRRHTAIVYAGLSGADSEGDFIPYEGRGSTDYRVGAYGECSTPRSGTLSGCIQYAQGKHRGIGWSATRLPELYFPYVSTDSCGGDFKFDSYYAEGNYGLTLGEWTLGVKGSFYGEQAYRLTDPRALNNTTWLRFGTGAARQVGSHLLMLDLGYGRNKQHLQLRYWRPGQQDRFFVCYGFGLYDTRQSAVSFGKSRMYYIDEFNGCLQYLSPRQGKLRLHLSADYAYDHMETEESDIYNLYESRSHTVSPLLRLTYEPLQAWRFELMGTGRFQFRKGYENIIEEYLIDKENNIYDFRTIDTRQNYSRDVSRLTGSLRATRRLGRVQVSLQGGVTADTYEECYASAGYRIKLQTLTPFVAAAFDWQSRRDAVSLSLLYGRQTVGTHQYDVEMQNQQIAHLDFQHAFAPYAFRCADLDRLSVDVTWQHQFSRMAVGLNAKAYLADGHRSDDVVYKGTIGFPSTAPMPSAQSDTHRERWAGLTAFVTF